ncbi:unnamed protein product [Ceratitis capitata]|uniref:(Mediterranean fruit fly) hypothetical protein n=1 Tax=Ceratitis capitata TaxID=7213 RepID=A0A811UG30_CERCA|nr:unnamed protein product [Ceratitis capitata]
MPRLKDGIKELNIPPMDPFIIERNNIEIRSSFVQGRAQIRNVRVFGISEGNVQKGNYKADMTLNEVKMTPKGYFNVTMSDLTLSSESEGELYERDGHINLVPDPALNAVILDFVNQYWRQVYKVMLPQTRSTWEPMF